MESDIYYSIESKAEGIFKDKGSKFFAFAFPFDQADHLKKYLDEIKSIHPKARHYCFAYKIGHNQYNFRVNDDGEPSGSAGKPILNALLSKNVTNTLIVVVRYFGGTLLGVPGLINAYKSASLDAIENSRIEIKYIKDIYRLKYEFDKTNEVMRIVKEFTLKIVRQDYIENCIMEVEIRQSMAEKVTSKFEDLRFVDITLSNEI